MGLHKITGMPMRKIFYPSSTKETIHYMESKFQLDSSVVLKVQKTLAIEPAGKDVQVLQGEC